VDFQAQKMALEEIFRINYFVEIKKKPD